MGAELKMLMTAWQYGLAYYSADGKVEAHPEYMNDMQGRGEQNVPHFFADAGGKGWEFCTFLPLKDAKGHDGYLIFKRPL
jgi:hypothetical protein